MAKKPSKSNVLAYTPKKQAAAGGKAVPPDSGVPRQDDTRVMALDLPRGQLSPAMEAYFKKCQEKLGFVPNVLLAYAFDNAKLEAFAAFYNDLMLAPSGPLQARARDDRGGRVGAEPLLLLPHRAWRRGAHLLGRSGARREDGDELSRREADQKAARDARLLGEDHGGVLRRSRTRTATRCAASDSPIATSSTSRRWRASSTCRTAWRARRICARTRCIMGRGGSAAVVGALLAPIELLRTDR